MGTIVNKIHREVKVVKTFEVLRTLIEGSTNYYSVQVPKKKVITAHAEKITYRTVQDMFKGQQQIPLMYLPYDKKKFDLLTHALITLDDYRFEILPDNVRGKLGYMVEMRTKDFRLIKRIAFSIDGEMADCANYPVDGLPQFIGEYIAVLHEILFKEKIDFDNNMAVLGIVNNNPIGLR